MQTAKFIFFLKHEKANQVTGEEPIYCRITVNGKRSNISINRWVDPKRWNETNKLQSARKSEDKELILYMESILLRLKQIEREMIENKTPITSENIKNVYSSKSGNAKKSKSLIEVFEWHNEKFKELVLSGGAANGSLDRYKQALNHIKAFLKHHYNRTDIYLDEIEFSFITNFDHYLRTERKNEKGRIRKCANNSTVKYIRNFRKIIKRAVDEGWLKFDVFASYKGKVKETDRVYLTPEEIKIIENKEINIERLNVVRDIFLFSIYTGYAYVDVKNLTYNHIQKHIDGELWIFTKRMKTKINENVMLLYPAIQLIEKYKSHPVCMQKGVLFPIPTNQRINGYLKELADVCGIQKKLTFHTARHSFATSIMLANGISMETTRDALGQIDIKQTQHYAKMLNSKVSQDMKNLNKKFKPKGDDDAEMPAEA